MKTVVTLAAMALALTACDRSDPPVKKLERAAEDAVVAVEGETLPQRAEGPYAPRNECLDEPGASEFLASLRKAVQARDTELLAPLVAEDIRLDFGGGAGRATLAERLAEDEGALWEQLDEVIALGCASDGATLTMPWYFAQDLQTEADGSELYLVAGDQVPVLDAPGEDADPLGTISWDLVEYVSVPMAEHSGYRGIIFQDETSGEEVTGFVRVADLRSYIGYRLLASRRNNRWRITSFVAGD